MWLDTIQSGDSDYLLLLWHTEVIGVPVWGAYGEVILIVIIMSQVFWKAINVNEWIYYREQS